MTAYQDHIKREMPKLRGKGLSPAQAMSAAAKSWREHGKNHSAAHMKVMKEETAKGKSFSAAHKVAMKQQVGKGARTSKRQSNAMLDQLDSLPVPKALPKGRAKRSKAAAPMQIENCTDVESCKLQIRLLLQQQPPSWLKGNADKVRDMVYLLREEDEVSSSIDAGKRKLGALDRQIMQLAKSFPI